MQSMLRGAPWLVAHRSMLQGQKPRKVSLYGNDYVMWQGEDNQIHALPNACPHMGAMLSEGWFTADHSRVVCPFHALEFNGGGCTVLPGTQKQTQSLLKPLDLIIQGDFIWSYGAEAPKLPIPQVLNEIAAEFSWIGVAGDRSINTDLLSMLLNMHDYNHQNGTHRDLFKITEVEFHKFIDEGHHSEAFYDMPTAPYDWVEKLRKPDLMVLPPVIKAHLDNYFPAIVIFRGSSAFGKLAQCHLFVPEGENRTRTYVLMFAQGNPMALKVLGKTYLKFAEVVVAQDADILDRIYSHSPQKVKLNNEVGMDWVRRNFEGFPAIVGPNLSK
jgi:phenylpropionate dioxygenase-like ring-hydroxylating dioxygenase large terminal subunit